MRLFAIIKSCSKDYQNAKVHKQNTKRRCRFIWFLQGRRSSRGIRPPTFVAGVAGIAANRMELVLAFWGKARARAQASSALPTRMLALSDFTAILRLQETTVANDGGKAGVFGASENGAGVLGYSRDPASPAVFAFGGFRSIALGKPLAGLFDGKVQVNGDVQVTATSFSLAPTARSTSIWPRESRARLEPSWSLGSGGTLKPCHRAYDKKAAGVVSGAGKFKPGIILDKQPSDYNRLPIALIGKVYL